MLKILKMTQLLRNVLSHYEIPLQKQLQTDNHLRHILALKMFQKDVYFTA